MIDEVVDMRILSVDEAKATILNRHRDAEDYSPVLLKHLEELFGRGATPASAVEEILGNIRREGDRAINFWSEKLDGKSWSGDPIPSQRLEAAYQNLDHRIKEAVELAILRVRDYHTRQILPDWTTSEMGGTLGQRFTPVERVGIYVPGGSAPLPSSLIMSAVPAQVAGVAQIVVCTPPDPHESILAIARILGLEEVYPLGGAQAIGAMAYGTASMTQVDKIVGAGNLFVTLAKQQVYGVVGLDGLAGPTETLIIADGSAQPAWVAADLLAQAEHDPLASAILLTPDEQLAKAVAAEIEIQLEQLSRRDIILQSLRDRSGIVITPDLDTAVALSNQYAPEHLCLALEAPADWIDAIQNAGGIFVGERSFEVLGDYVAGPSHVMPTGGSARFASPLNVLDFVKITSLVALDDETCTALVPPAVALAEVETLTAHAASARRRVEGATDGT
jgi:histidinol dehydrogenase